MFTTTASRKVLVPLATLLAAGAVAVGSGATWTSSTDSAVSVTAGDLLHTNDQDGATLTIEDMIPGDSMTGTVTVENTGSADSKLDLAVSGVTSTFSDYLTVTVTEGATELYDGPFNGLDDPTTGFAQTDIDFNSGDIVTYTVTVTLTNDTTGTTEEQNVDQGMGAGAAFTWTQTQVDGNSSLTELWN